ncbi:hypothetical protein J9345_20780 [Bacillus subtilis subsp. subtilis]|uniref:hypothetical protein n=1 Tax=Bacillus subtilis TaxID=1423 RepID=UPI001AECAD00|nr:hypothetical protein [Bacillus subtilis subsp. subtilis]
MGVIEINPSIRLYIFVFLKAVLYTLGILATTLIISHYEHNMIGFFLVSFIIAVYFHFVVEKGKYRGLMISEGIKDLDEGKGMFSKIDKTYEKKAKSNSKHIKIRTNLMVIATGMLFLTGQFLSDGLNATIFILIGCGLIFIETLFSIIGTMKFKVVLHMIDEVYREKSGK